MIFGVDYYPEQWPESRWEQDARQMRQAGLQVVRLAEFAWARLEPEEGRFEWDWLDRAIDTLHQAGLDLILGTPTASPPAWLTRRYPDTLPVDENEVRRQFGGRRHYCPNSGVYRQHCQRIVTALAERYGQDRRVVGWQIDNEFGGGKTARCYCPNCAAAFRCWLQKRYDNDLEALNSAWGAVFWSQAYQDWEQIQPPILNLASPNPSQALDYDRFASDSIVDFQQEQVEILRQANQGRQWITHNFMGLFPDLDQFRLAANLDFASWDSYPTGNLDRWREVLYPLDDPYTPPYAYDVGDPLVTGMAHDLTRGLKQAPFWVMEQQAGQINWGAYNPDIRPGTLRLWVWHALASGASGMVYFRWRATVLAQEQYHSGLLQHDGTPDQGLIEVEQIRAERELMDQVAAQPLAAQVAMLFNFDDLWALQLQPHRRGFGYLRHLFAYYQALLRLGLPVDLVPPAADLSTYRLVLAPSAHLVGDGLAEALEAYVRQGGNLLLGVRTGFKTPSNLVTDQPLPGWLRPLAGVTVRAWHSLPAGVSYPFESSVTGLTGPATVWAEGLEPLAAVAGALTPLATYTGGPLQGKLAISQQRLGLGSVTYAGIYPTWPQARALAAHLAGQAGLPVVPDLPEGLVLGRRGPYRLLMNFTDRPLAVTLDGRSIQVAGRDLQIIEDTSL